MTLSYLQLFPDMRELLEAYDDAQKGRLLMALMDYAFDGTEPSFDGPERYIWPALRRHVDQSAAKAERVRTSGAKGGEAKQRNIAPDEPEQSVATASEAKRNVATASEAKRNVATASEAKRNVATASERGYKQEQEQEHIQEQEHSTNVRTDARAGGMYDGVTPDEVVQHSTAMTAIEDEARRVGVPVACDADREQIDLLIAEHPPDAILHALRAIGGKEASKRTWRYVAGILRSEKARGYTWQAKTQRAAMPDYDNVKGDGVGW